MSKLVKAVRAHKGISLPVPDLPHLLITDGFSTKSDFYTEYTIKAEIGAKVCVQTQQELAPAIQSAKRRIVEEIFGEFRKNFRSIEGALYERDVHKAIHELRVFEAEMYEV